MSPYYFKTITVQGRFVYITIGREDDDDWEQPFKVDPDMLLQLFRCYECCQNYDFQAGGLEIM